MLNHKNPVQLVFTFGFLLLALANLFFALLTFAIKAQKYGTSSLWQEPDSFAVGTTIIGLLCLIAAYWFYQKKSTL